jgi:hypothetical protein
VKDDAERSLVRFGGPRPVWLPLVITGALALAAVACAVIIARRTDLAWVDFWKFAVTALFTLGTGLLLSGVVALLLRRRDERTLLLQQELDLRWELIAQLRGVHRDVKRAQLLIAAHRSVKTYGEQMREGIMPAEVTVRDVLFMVRRSPRLAVEGKRSELERCLGAVVRYLGQLREEFTNGYEAVSATQLAAEEWNREEVKSIITSLRRVPSRPLLHGRMKRSEAPWAALTSIAPTDGGASAAAFPCLNRLLKDADSSPDPADGSQGESTHRKDFSEPLHRAIDLMLQSHDRRRVE